jgi:hypothetical protein
MSVDLRVAFQDNLLGKHWILFESARSSDKGKWYIPSS